MKNCNVSKAKYPQEKLHLSIFAEKNGNNEIMSGKNLLAANLKEVQGMCPLTAVWNHWSFKR